ncbi:protein disulfide-isomerase like 2-1 [Carex littledalei]|uniref:Protein disulfide-isomerase like 2-1 n=1 Tax=Carex littledalei TaxID=544730 RepID=A0A833R7E0_9POAL|nr:protein disulfide-isomerase like 2-1 [Carex littledalei]
MARSQVLIALAITLFAALAIADNAVVLTPENFDEEVGQDRYALVEFFTPWCGHCQKLAPDYERLASSFKKTDTVLIAKVDCTEYYDLCAKYDVTGYPTIHWFPKGSMRPRKYEGIRTADDLADFVNAEADTNVKLAFAPSYVVVLTSETLDQVVYDETKDVLVEFYTPWLIYEKVASAFKLDKHIVIANVDIDQHKDLSEKYGVKKIPTIKFFSKENKEGELFEGEKEIDDVKCGTSRDSEGQLTSEAGIIESLDEVVKEFVAATNDEKNNILTKIEHQVSKLTGPAARYGKDVRKSSKEYHEKRCWLHQD